MTWVKICGMTNLEDALQAVEAGADALGFVFYEKSPRNVEVETARAIVAKLPETVEKVGVFVGGLGEPAVLDIFNHTRLTAIQLHSDVDTFSRDASNQAYGRGRFWQPPKMYQSWRASFLIEQGDAFRRLASSGSTFFLDSSTSEKPGGTGIPFDWKKAQPLVDSLKNEAYFVVAGGLTPTNVVDAIDTLHPWGVDVASGVEARPGKKDPDKVRAFLQAVRRAEKGT
jgi:phosphoribosylanthranilate isomerase